MTLLWVSISIILALNSIWMLKLNKDLANRNEYLIRQVEANRHNGGLILEPMSDEQREEIKRAIEEGEVPLKPLTSKQKELLKKNPDDNKED